MSTAKRRKGEAESAPPPPPPPPSGLSAVARRRAAQAAAAAAAAAAQAEAEAEAPTAPTPAPGPMEEGDASDDAIEEAPKPKPKTKRKRTVTVKVERVQKVVETVARPPQDEPEAIDPEEDDAVMMESTPESEDSPLPEAPSPPAITKGPVQLSTLVPSKDSVTVKDDGVVELKLVEGERLLILGSYGLRVLSGEVMVYGAHLRASDPVAWIHAPLCHAVPVVRSPRQTVVELLPHPHGEPLRRLEKLSPLFRKLWHNARPEGKKGRTPTFQILVSPDDVPKRAVVQDLVSPPQWNKAIAETIAGQAPTVLVCGPKSSGKSTFGRILANKLLTSLSSKARTTGVAVLDLDPGQPEFAPAGIISLVHCAGPNLSPPFAHAIADGTTTIHRSHATGSLTPASDPHLYLEACLDLFAHYTRGLSRCPLVVNTPGWVQGTGLDLLVELVAGINPSHVVYMSEDGPGESVESLSGASRGRFVALPSQQAEFSSRTAAHLRAMQAMSYFHGGRVGGLQAWDPTPVTARVPWEVCYGGASPGIAAVLCYEFQPPAELLAEAINGAVLSLVEAEDAKALRELDGPAFAEAMDVDDSEDVGVDASAPSTIPSSTVSRSPEGLPYILNPDSTSLDPRHSRALGHVLVRGIDPARRALQLLTPVSLDSIRAARAAGHALVLVLGRLDAPAWAYTEDLYERTAPAETARGVGDDNDGSESEGEGEGDMGGGGLEGGAAPAEARRVAGADVPWIETLEGHEKRPAGSKAWRVRRDLGRGGNEA